MMLIRQHPNNNKECFMKFIFSLLLLVGSIFSLVSSLTVNAEGLPSIDAIWNNVGVTKKVIQPPARVPKQQVVAHQAKKQKTTLERQRAAWRAKWEAQQRAKKSRSLQVAQKKPVPLTKAQYQERWKQAQLTQQKSAPVHTYQNQYAAYKTTNQRADLQQLPPDIIAMLSKAGVGKQGISAYVQDVNATRPLLAFQDNTSRVPASVMKLITSYAALGILGPNYRWPIDVYSRGKIQNGTLYGDLILKGYGSPEFNTQELQKVLRGIRQKGIQNISGRIVFDNSYFDPVSRYEASFDGKALSAYNAKPDALLFNERLSTFNIKAGRRSVQVSTTTPTHHVNIINHMKKAKRSCRPRIHVSKKGVQTYVTFSGYFARRCGTRTYSRVISEPSKMIYGAMKSMWKRDVGGYLKTQYAKGKVPAGSRLLLRNYSRTLAQILPTIDKDSNNVMARQLLLTIGAVKSKAQGTEKNGAIAVGEWLASRGLYFPELRIENGSGLSRLARISARHLGHLLIDAYHSPYQQVLMRSLAVAGVDGTMKRRLRKTRVKGRGFFKTGSLRDVRSIAGYVKAANGRTYAVTILHNDRRALRRARPAHDKLIEWVYAGANRPRYAMK